MQFTLNGLLRSTLKKIVERLLNIASKWIKCKKLLALLLLFYCHGIYSRMNTCTFTYIDLIEVSFALFVLFWGIFALYFCSVFFCSPQTVNWRIFRTIHISLNTASMAWIWLMLSFQFLLFYFTWNIFFLVPFCAFHLVIFFSWCFFCHTCKGTNDEKLSKKIVRMQWKWIWVGKFY